MIWNTMLLMWRHSTDDTFVLLHMFSPSGEHPE